MWTSVMPVRMGSKLTVMSSGELLIVAPKLLRLVEFSRWRKVQGMLGFERPQKRSFQHGSQNRLQNKKILIIGW